MVTSTYVASAGEKLVLDPLAPSPDQADVWKRLDENPPTAAVVLKPDHVRDVDLFVRRYGARPFGPWLFYPDDVPKSKLQEIESGYSLPGGLVALDDGRGRMETPLWLPEQRVIVFADTLTERAGELRIWYSPWHEQRVLPALHSMLELPFERVVISHCDAEPVHPREEFERALKRPPWKG